MTRTGRPRAELTLSDAQRAQLERIARGTTDSALALRAELILASAQGASNKAVAERYGVSQATVAKWRFRFAEHGLKGLRDQPRPGRPVSVSPQQVNDVVAATLTRRPPEANRWTRAAMSAESGLSGSTVGRIWRRHGIAPHQPERVGADGESAR